MTKGFWERLPRPILALAPMSDVTDAACRQMMVRHGKPDIIFTEFVAVDGLVSAGRKNLLRDLIFQENERPVVAQLFGEKPEHFLKAAELMVELGFDGVDINMGCPMKTVTKTGAGAALINSPDLAKEIIYATAEGAKSLPVSVKTRIGYNRIAIEEWVGHLLEAEPVAIILHLRTRKEMSLVDAHWDVIHEAVKLAKKTETLILGNGDVRDLQHANELVEETGIDGIMLGRAVFGNPWLFDRKRSNVSVTVREKLDAMIEHAILFEEILGEKKNFSVMKKHLRSYAAGFAGSKELRMEMMVNADSAGDVKRIAEKFLSTFSEIEK